MTLTQLIEEIRARKIHLFRSPTGMLLYTCPGKLTPEITASIRYYQGALGDLLTQQSARQFAQ
jgi:hypothetical protein